MALVSRYDFNNSFKDQIGENHLKTLSDTSIVESRVGSALSLNGTTSQAYVEDNNGILKNKFSISLWSYKLTEGEAFTCEFAVDGVFYFRMYQNTLQARIWTEQVGDSGNITFTGGISYQQWHHMVATFDGVTLELFLDGVSQGTYQHQGTLTKNSNPMLIGGRNRIDAYHFDGYISDIRIYDGVLSLKEIKDLHMCEILHIDEYSSMSPAENIYDLSVSNKTWTRHGTMVSFFNALSDQSFEVVGTGADTNDMMYVYPAFVTDRGKHYTLSCTIENRGNLDIKIRLLIRDGTNDAYITSEDYYTIKQKHTQRLTISSHTKTSGSNGYITPTISVYPSSDGSADVKVLDIQLEEGEVATEFTPDKRYGIVTNDLGDDSVPSLTSPKLMYDESCPVSKYSLVFDRDRNTMLRVPYNVNDAQPQAWTSCGWIFLEDRVTNYQSFENINHDNRITHSGSRPLLYANSGGNDHYVYGSDWGSDDVGKWHHIAFVYNNQTTRCEIYIDGELDKSSTNFSSGESPKGHSSDLIYGGNFHGRMAGMRFFGRDLSADEIREVYSQRGSVDDRNSFHSKVDIAELPHTPLIVDYTVWKEGQTGDVTGFSSNGSSWKNGRVLGDDPWGRQAVLWETIDTDTSSTADGGWNGTRFPVDNTKLYRFSVWIRRTNKGNGSYYFGTRGYGSESGVISRGNGNVYTNPYFHAGGWGWPEGEWILFVGFVWPEGSGTGADHPDTGYWNAKGEKIGDGNRTDFVWRDGTTESLHRSYLYYSSDLDTRQQWCYPRVDICDGTEPSMEELTSGFDSKYFDFVKSNKNGFFLSAGSNNHVAKLTETGSTKSPQVYLPLENGYEDATGNAAVYSKGASRIATEFVTKDGYFGADFSGSPDDDVRFVMNSPLKHNGDWTISFCINPRKFSGLNSYPIFLNFFWSSYFAVNSGGGSMRVSYKDATGAQQNLSTGASMNVDEWTMFTCTHNSVTGELRLYKNGQLVGSKIDTLLDTTKSYFNIGNYTSASYYTDGVMRELMVFDFCVGSNEIGQLYKKCLPSGTKLSGDGEKGALYVMNEINEV